MKKINKIITGSILVLSIFISGYLLSTKVFATNIPTLSIGSTNAIKGTHISIPITASYWNNSVSSMDILVKYDPTVLSIDSITENPNLADPLFNKNYSSNMIYLGYMADVDTNFDLNNGVIATLNFTVVSNTATNTPLTFKITSPGLRSKLYDVYGTPIPANFVGGSVNVTLPIPVVPKSILPVSRSTQTVKSISNKNTTFVSVE